MNFRRELQLGEFLLSLHEASCTLSTQDFRYWTLGKLRKLLDFDFAIWGAGEGRSRDIHTVTILDQSPNLFETWEPVKQEDRFANIVIGNTGQSWTLTDLPKTFLKTRAYNEHWRRYCAKQMLSTMEVDKQTGLHVFLTLCRDSATQPSFTSDDKELKGLITRHVFLAAKHNEYFLLNSEDPSGTTAIIDRFGTVHSSGVAFDELVEKEWCRVSRRRLPLTGDAFHTGVYQGKHIRLKLLRFGDRYITQAQPSNLLDCLSRREHEIATLYAMGYSYKEIAKGKAISPNTVRNHLQAIYFKLEIRDKAQLSVLLTKKGLCLNS